MPTTLPGIFQNMSIMFAKSHWMKYISEFEVWQKSCRHCVGRRVLVGSPHNFHNQLLYCIKVSLRPSQNANQTSWNISNHEYNVHQASFNVLNFSVWSLAKRYENCVGRRVLVGIHHNFYNQLFKCTTVSLKPSQNAHHTPWNISKHEHHVRQISLNEVNFRVWSLAKTM